MLASTTSVEDSGLLDALLPTFHEAEPGYQVKVIAVGSGEALELGARGDADIVIAHSPEAEQRFLDAGHARARTVIMANDFVIVGPAIDVAGVRGASVRDAMTAIAASGAPFVSRGDGSGTHTREQALWQDAGVAPDGQPWYMAIGQGMGDALRIASERGAYTLSDRATYLAFANTLLLEILVEGDSGLVNRYSVITTTRGRNHEGADALAGWLADSVGQAHIGAFGRERFGRPLFEPIADTP